MTFVSILIFLNYELLRDLQETFVDALTCLCRSFYDLEAVVLLKFSDLFICDLHFFRVNIRLVGKNEYGYIWSRVLFYLLEPAFEVQERLFVIYIEDNYDAVGPLIVSIGNSAVSFLAGSVPNLELDINLIDLQGSEAEIDSNSTDVVFLEAVVCESHQEAGLSNVSVADQDELEEMIIFSFDAHFSF